MNIFKKFSYLSFSLLAFLSFSHTASALPQHKWTKVCTELLGLRSGANHTDIHGAGYGMNDGNKETMNCLKPAPKEWDDILRETLSNIKNFPDSSNRYLLIVTKCPGLSRDYKGAFPKCNKIGGSVMEAMPTTIEHHTVDQMATWVLDHI